MEHGRMRRHGEGDEDDVGKSSKKTMAIRVGSPWGKSMEDLKASKRNGRLGTVGVS